MSTHSKISHERLLELVDYNQLTGKMIWKVNRRRAKAGSELASIDSDGYLICKIDNIQYKVHRLAWFYVNKSWPIGEIDHRNGNRKDNRIDNLRDSTIAQNRQSRPRRDNSTGFKGVFSIGRRFRAKIQANGIVYQLGKFDSAEKAHVAYVNKARELHGEYADPELDCA